MTDQITSQTTSRSQQPVGGFPLGAWVRANAVGLGIAYALFALFGGVAEELGAAHDSVTRNVAILAGLFIGAAVFALMRRKVLAPHLGSSPWTAVAAGVSLTAGFVLGFIMAGPPFDFVLATGDDRTDEDLFARLDPDAFTVHIGGGGSRANASVGSPASVRRLLKALCEARRNRLRV